MHAKAVDMNGSLTEDEIDHLLRSERVGRIGCAASGRVYVVPVTFVYEGGCVYGQSGLGLKVQMMRSNPNVCFQADQISSPFEWRSVIAWGTYEELSGEEAENALEQLMRWTANSDDDGYALGMPPSGHSLRQLTRQLLQVGVIYRIRLSEKTGRFQQSLSSQMDWPLQR